MNNETVDSYFSSTKDKKAAVRFFERIFKMAGATKEANNGQEWSQFSRINKRRLKKKAVPIK